jgi:arylsulfatase
MVVVLSDNGASSEGGPFGSMNDNRSWNLAPSSLQESLARLDEIGGPTLHNNYPWGWTVAGNTPFRRWKREVHEGGVADPLVVSWPRGLGARGEVRDHYVHSVDVFPTILEACGAAPADDIDGLSFLASARDPGVPSQRHVQYYEMFGCRALWRDGWKAVSYHPIQAPDPGLENAPWELYDTRVDPSECHDLALDHPGLLAELIDLWWSEAERNQVLPLDNRPLSDLVFTRPHPIPERSSYTFWPGTSMVGDSAMVSVRNRTHTITAHVTDATHGVLLGQGSVLGGWVVFLDGGRLCWVHSYLSASEDRATSGVLDLIGEHELAVRFTRTWSHEGTIELLLDGTVVGGCEVPRFTPNRFTITGAGQWCGRPGPSPVCADPGAGAPVDGVLHRVVVDVEGPAWFDPVLEAQRAIMRQ